MKMAAFRRNRHHKGFTLIELLLWVTLSAILMTGIVVFVGSSLTSNMTTKTLLEEWSKNEAFDQRLTEVIWNISGSGIFATGSSFGWDYFTGVILSIGGSHPPMSFLWIKSETGYCDSTRSVLKLVLRQITTPTIQNTSSYILSSTGNSIYSGSTRILGTGYPGNNVSTSGTGTELSSPTALIEKDNHLYIADTMNDRILSYNINSWSVDMILDSGNGLKKPTELFFTGQTLLVASSGNGTIYSLRDGDWNDSSFSATFKVSKIIKADALRFDYANPSTDPSVALSDFHFSGNISQTADDIVSTWTTYIQYTFSGAQRTFSPGSNIYKVNISGLTPTGAPINGKNQTMRIDFLSGGVSTYNDTFHYFTRWDGSLESSTGNILKVVASGITYPHNLAGEWSFSGTLDWSTLLSGNPSGDEIKSSLPIENLSYSIAGKVLTIRYNEYTHYDCSFWKHKTTEKLIKILLP